MFVARAFFDVVYPPISQCTVACVFLWIPGYFLANYIYPKSPGWEFLPQQGGLLIKGIFPPPYALKQLRLKAFQDFFLHICPESLAKGTNMDHQIITARWWTNSWPNLIFIRWVGYLTIRNLWRGHLSKYSNRLQILAGWFSLDVIHKPDHKAGPCLGG